MALFNGLARVNFSSTLASGQQVSNTFYVGKASLGSPPDLTTLTNLGTDLATWFSTTYRAILDTSAKFDTITVAQVSDPTAPAIGLEVQDAVALAGTRTPAGSVGPQSLCGVIQLKTPNASRRFRGHLFAPPSMNGGDVGSGDKINLASGYGLQLSNLAAKFAAGAGTSPTWTGTTLSTWTLSIYSKRAASLGLASVAICSTAVADGRWHWLRSRERGAR